MDIPLYLSLQNHDAIRCFQNGIFIEQVLYNFNKWILQPKENVKYGSVTLSYDRSICRRQRFNFHMVVVQPLTSSIWLKFV